MIRVEAGWIGAAGRQPAARSAARSAPSGSSGPSASISGSIRRWLTRRPASRRRPVAGGVGEGLDRVAAQRRPPARAARTRTPRQRPRSPDEDLGADPARRRRRGYAVAVQPLTALTAAQAASWRYEPGSLAATNASQAVVARSAVRGHDRRGRRRTSTMTATIDGSSGIRNTSDRAQVDRRRRPRSTTAICDEQHDPARLGPERGLGDGQRAERDGARDRAVAAIDARPDADQRRSRGSSGSRRSRMTSRASASSQAAIAIARAMPGSPTARRGRPPSDVLTIDREDRGEDRRDACPAARRTRGRGPRSARAPRGRPGTRAACSRSGSAPRP